MRVRIPPPRECPSTMKSYTRLTVAGQVLIEAVMGKDIRYADESSLAVSVSGMRRMRASCTEVPRVRTTSA